MAQPIRKPEYVDPAGDPRFGVLPVTPPFLFREVTTRVFPIKANMARLSHFCDQYVNMDIPPTIAHFRPSLPYVYLMVLNYGNMSAASVTAQNVGWVAQHEVTFTVPLQWWREENGELVFKDWACVSPFIFVDDQMSLTTGREVYGWPKVAARVDAEMPLWTKHPQLPTRLLSLSTHVFPKVYAGEPETERVLLEIDSAPPATFSQFPPDADNPWGPLSSLPGAARASWSLMSNAVDMLLALRIRGYRSNRTPAALTAMASKAGFNLACLLPDLLLPSAARREAKAPSQDGLPELYLHNITLKQFRDAEEPNQACYQALVGSRMGFDRLNQGGLLGDLNLLRGDPTGGYSVRIHRYTSQPIIESLGLEVAETQQESDGSEVAVLKPTFPFWTDVDLYYGRGHVICSRTPGTTRASTANWVDEQELVDETGKPTSRPPGVGGEPCRNPYNTALGAATQPVAGPFHFPDVTLQVYPLLADRAQIDAFLERYLNQPLEDTGMRFESFGSYVYLMVTVCEDQMGTMWSSTNNIGWWAEREVAFCVPVKWRDKDGLVSLGMVCPFVYSSNGRAVITDREVNGRPSVAATIDSPADVWLTRSGPVAERRLLHLETEVFPALNLGQQAQWRTLIDIDERDVLEYNADVAWRAVAEDWGEELVQDLKRKTYARSMQEQEVQEAKALALEILAYEKPVNWIILKQYRDAGDIERACYQAAVHTTRAITHIYDIREIEEPVHVRLHQYSGHPIAQALGLKIKSVDSTGGSVVQNIQPLRSFWMRIAMREDLGTVVGWRSGDENWTITHPWFGARRNTSEPTQKPPYFRAPGDTYVTPVELQGWRNPQRVKDKATTWLRESVRRQLAWIKANAQSLRPQEGEAVRSRLSTVEQAGFAQLQAADSLDLFCDSAPVEALVQLANALPRAGLPLAPLENAPPSERLVPSGDSPEALRARLEYIKQMLAEMPPVQRAALEITLSPELRKQLAELTAPEEVLPDPQRTQSVPPIELVIALDQSLQDWLYAPSQWQRLSHARAAQAIDALDEVQVVIESILSAEWENWGNPRWYRGLPPKPQQCVPLGSLYGTLERQRNGFAAAHDLSVFEKSWWYVEPPKQ